jgi:signal transduction histidine kinase
MELRGEICDLVQVLTNLISNSIQAYQGKAGCIDFTVTQTEHLIEFQICDTGMGIPNDIQAKLFKEIITTKGKLGTGLGLYVSYAIIKGKFGGDLWFESTSEKGTVFYISIPVKQNPGDGFKTGFEKTAN